MSNEELLGYQVGSMATIKEGDTAPAFGLRDKDGKEWRLADSEADYVVVFFYPKDNTPGCTIEAKEFSAALAKFKKLKTELVGISGGDDKSKEKFCNKHNLEVLLLSDTDFSVAKSFDAYGEKSFMGKKFQGIHRVTFVIDKNKKIIKVYEKVKPEGHAEEVIEFLTSL